MLGKRVGQGYLQRRAKRREHRRSTRYDLANHCTARRVYARLVIFTLFVCLSCGMIAFASYLSLRGKGLPKALAGITIAASVLMVAATAHSYLMPARPAWGIALLVFYLANAFALGAVAIWVLGIIRGDEESEKEGLSLAFVGSIVQLVADAIYVAACAMAKFTDFGHYADPTKITTAPTHIDSLLSVMTTGPAAGMFWGSLVCAIALVAIVLVAKKANGNALVFASLAGIVAVAGSLLFRVLIYMVGYAFVLLY